jgi:hypothetical protein
VSGEVFVPDPNPFHCSDGCVRASKKFSFEKISRTVPSKFWQLAAKFCALQSGWPSRKKPPLQHPAEIGCPLLRFFNQIDITIDPEMLAARAPLASGAGSDRCLYTQAIILPNIALMQAGNENRM